MHYICGILLQEYGKISKKETQKISDAWFFSFWRFTWWKYVQDSEWWWLQVLYAWNQKFHLGSMQFCWSRFDWSLVFLIWLIWLMKKKYYTSLHILSFRFYQDSTLSAVRFRVIPFYVPCYTWKENIFEGRVGNVHERLHRESLGRTCFFTWFQQMGYW